MAKGKPEVTDIILASKAGPAADAASGAATANELLRIAASAERGSEHPLAKGLLRAAAGVALPEVLEFRVHPGGGVSGQVGVPCYNSHVARVLMVASEAAPRANDYAFA